MAPRSGIDGPACGSAHPTLVGRPSCRRVCANEQHRQRERQHAVRPQPPGRGHPRGARHRTGVLRLLRVRARPSPQQRRAVRRGPLQVGGRARAPQVPDAGRAGGCHDHHQPARRERPQVRAARRSTTCRSRASSPSAATTSPARARSARPSASPCSAGPSRSMRSTSARSSAGARRRCNVVVTFRSGRRAPAPDATPRRRRQPQRAPRPGRRRGPSHRARRGQGGRRPAGAARLRLQRVHRVLLPGAARDHHAASAQRGGEDHGGPRPARAGQPGVPATRSRSSAAASTKRARRSATSMPTSRTSGSTRPCCRASSSSAIADAKAEGTLAGPRGLARRSAKAKYAREPPRDHGGEGPAGRVGLARVHALRDRRGDRWDWAALTYAPDEPGDPVGLVDHVRRGALPTGASARASTSSWML